MEWRGVEQDAHHDRRLYLYLCCGTDYLLCGVQWRLGKRGEKGLKTRLRRDTYRSGG
jgi:hypothetical protein